MILACEICAYDERLRFRYATMDNTGNIFELVHGIVLDQDGRSVKPPSFPNADDPRNDPAVVTPKPRR